MCWPFSKARISEKEQQENIASTGESVKRLEVVWEPKSERSKHSRIDSFQSDVDVALPAHVAFSIGLFLHSL
jgi:hypothetical protein